MEQFKYEDKTNPNYLMKKMDYTLQYGSFEDLKKLFDEDGIDVDQTDFQGRTALQLYSYKGKEECVKYLINKGANVNAVMMYHGDKPMTALDAAIEKDRTEIIEILITNGAKRGKDLKN